MIVGIDLGTSNCAVAFADPSHGSDAALSDFPVPQLQRLGEVAARPLLPSFLYLPAQGELPPEGTRLPWGDSLLRIVGEFARWQGARVPGRMVSSAKSWLCHPSVDRTAAILPWGAPSDVAKLSPVDASAEYLRHIRSAWNLAHPGNLLEDQEVVVTVPASFDEVARSLTVRAVRDAGLEKFTLIEEPEAAFYDFTARHRQELRETLENIRLVLVVDVGGGTSDFTLVRIHFADEGPQLERIAVGDHLMLGGDNMDAAVARRAEERVAAGGRKLSAAQWIQLVQGAREAKEKLLSADPPEGVRLAIAAEGSRLFGGTLSAQVTRDEVEQLVVEGFLPRCGPGDSAKRGSRAALQELGLPYAQDAAITRHLADFLRKHAQAAWSALGESPRGLPRPDAILLNGGVFNSRVLAERLAAVVSSWWPERPPIPLLKHSSLDLAVARGAAYYGLVRHGLGLRIRGGAAHSLFIGLGSADSSSPPQALCVIPRGHEQGETIELRDRPFQLALGKPVQFPLYSTTSDRSVRAGSIVPVTDELEALPPIHTLLKGRSTGLVPIHLRATMTEIGTLELSCVSTTTNEQWRLEFELRGAAADSSLVTTESMPPRFSEARQAVEWIFSPKAKPPKVTLPAGSLPKDVKQLWAALERTLGPRAQWSVPVLRELWTSLFAGAPRRRRTPEHERIYFQLLGYCLRPGFGYPLDEWRCSESFALFSQAVEFHKEKPNWTEFWVLWRRIAPGLTEAQQTAIASYLQPHLDWRVASATQKNLLRPKGIQPEGFDEMIKTVASLEHLSPGDKERLGAAILPQLSAAGSSNVWPWALGRLGARVPVRASSHKVVAPDTAASWIEQLLRLDWQKIDGAAFAATQIARLSGDRVRDIDEPLRRRVIDKLQAINAPASWIHSLTEVVILEKADQARVLGDTLPAGLRIMET